MCWWWFLNFSVKIFRKYLLSCYVCTFFQNELPKLFLKLFCCQNTGGWKYCRGFSGSYYCWTLFRQCLLKALSAVVSGRWVSDVVNTLYFAGGNKTIDRNCQRNLTISKKDTPNLRLSLGCRRVIYLLSPSPHLPHFSSLSST